MSYLYFYFFFFFLLWEEAIECADKDFIYNVAWTVLEFFFAFAFRSLSIKYFFL